MAKSYRDITRAVSASLGQLRANQHDLMGGFSALANAALREGTLSKKTKELIALCLGVALRRVHRLPHPGTGQARSDPSRDRGSPGVAVYMGGGPSLMYTADALAAFDQMSLTAATVPA